MHIVQEYIHMANTLAALFGALPQAAETASRDLIPFVKPEGLENKPFRIEAITTRENKRFGKTEIAFTVTCKDGSRGLMCLAPDKAGVRQAMLDQADAWVEACKAGWLTMAKKALPSGKYTWVFKQAGK